MTRPARAELFAAAALAALTIAAALGLGRVFDDGSFALPVIGAAVLPHAVGAVARLRKWSGVVLGLVTFAVVVLFVALVVAPGSTTYGIPGPATLDVLARRLSAGWDVFRTGRAPVPVTDGVLLLCMVLTAAVATTADLLAFKSEATLAAIVPSLLLFVFASTLGTTELRTVTTIGYSIVALVFLMLQHQALLERHRSWASGRRLGSHATWINAAGFVGGIALLIGLVVAPALPGADDGPLLDYRNLGGGSGSGGASDFRTLSPLVDLRAQLTEQSDNELFQVEAPTRLYWRIAALDRFDGTVWGIESRARDIGEELGRRRPQGSVRQRYTISALGDRWLPAAYQPLATDLEDARIVPESGTLVAPDSITGLTYRVDSRVAAPPTEEEIAATLDAPPDEVASSLELPDDFPFSVEREARRIVAGSVVPYEQAMLLEDYFARGDFVYDLKGPEGSGSDAIVDFLRSRRGFCEQFAGAFAAMARSLGLPARVAVGFTAGRYDESLGAFRVRARDAHAWPEVYLAGLGWTQFEPTPAGDEPGQADGDLGEPAAEDPTASTTPTTRATATTTPSRTPANPVPRGEATIEAGSASTTGDGGSDDHWLVLIAAALAGAVVAVVWAASRVGRKVRRRTRRRRAAVPAHSVAGAWQDALERLGDAGFPPSETLTPHEQVARYAEGGAPGDTADPLADLADVYARAGWSWREPTDEDVARAWSDADAVRDALAEGASNRERVRRALRV